MAIGKTLYIVRGFPNVGKSTLGKQLAFTDKDGHTFSYQNDDGHTDDFGQYNFDPKRRKQAIKECKTNVFIALEKGVPRVAVCNVFSRKKSMQPYFEMAAKFGYVVVVLHVEGNTSGKSNGHDVPQDVLDIMQKQWENLK